VVAACDILVIVFTNIVTLVFFFEDLGLGFGGSAHGTNFGLRAEAILVWNVVVAEELVSRDVLKHNGISVLDALALALFTSTNDRLDAPYCVVNRLRDNADFLVAREARINGGGQG